MNFRMLSDIIELEGMLKVSSQTVGELCFDNSHLADENRDLRELLDEKNKDIADLAQELREVKEKLSKLEAWHGKEKENNNS